MALEMSSDMGDEAIASRIAVAEASISVRTHGYGVDREKNQGLVRVAEGMASTAASTSLYVAWPRREGMRWQMALNVHRGCDMVVGVTRWEMEYLYIMFDEGE